MLGYGLGRKTKNFHLKSFIVSSVFAFSAKFFLKKNIRFQTASLVLTN
jgi:hypothetical protein